MNLKPSHRLAPSSFALKHALVGSNVRRDSTAKVPALSREDPWKLWEKCLCLQHTPPNTHIYLHIIIIIIISFSLWGPADVRNVPIIRYTAPWPCICLLAEFLYFCLLTTLNLFWSLNKFNIIQKTRLRKHNTQLSSDLVISWGITCVVKKTLRLHSINQILLIKGFS